MLFRTGKVILATMLCATAMQCRQDNSSFDVDAEQELLQLLNQERLKNNLPPFKLNQQLQQAARAHAPQMAERHELSHQFPGEPALRKRLAATGLRSERDAENVAFNQDAVTAHEGLMHSPPHRANILNPNYDAVGIAAIRRGESLYVVEDFAQIVPGYSSSELEKNVAASVAHVRSSAHLGKLTQRKLPRLNELACAMAHQDKMDPAAALRLTDVRSAITYTTSQPARLPPNAATALRKDADASAFAVGGCFARTPRAPGGTYWIVLVTY